MDNELFNVNYEVAERVMGWKRTETVQDVLGYEGEYLGSTNWLDDEGDPAMLPDFWNSEAGAYRLVTLLARQGVSFHLEPHAKEVRALFSDAQREGRAESRSVSEAITFAALRFYGVEIPF